MFSLRNKKINSWGSFEYPKYMVWVRNKRITFFGRHTKIKARAVVWVSACLSADLI